MRVAHGFVLASTAIVASSVIATLALLQHEPPQPHFVELPPPAYTVPVVGPRLGFATPPLLNTECPRFSRDEHVWIDPLGGQNSLHCDGARAIARAAGEDGQLGTDDDSCSETTASCATSRSLRPDGL